VTNPAPRALRHSKACNSMCDLVPLPWEQAYQLVCLLCGPLPGYIPTRTLVERGLIRPPQTESHGAASPRRKRTG
jgi:hypothetical protein